MLTIGDGGGRMGRRDFLRVGTLGLGGLSLAGMLGTRAAADGVSRVVADRSVIFLFMHGGPTQIETFDPKMSAPEGVRSVVGDVKTSLPGVTFGASLPKIARMARHVCVVRSFVTGDGNHDIKPI